MQQFDYKDSGEIYTKVVNKKKKHTPTVANQ